MPYRSRPLPLAAEELAARYVIATGRYVDREAQLADDLADLSTVSRRGKKLRHVATERITAAASRLSDSAAVADLADAICAEEHGRVGLCRTLTLLLLSPCAQQVAFLFDIRGDSPLVADPTWLASLVGDPELASLELAEAWMQLVVAASLADPAETPMWMNVGSLAGPTRTLRTRFPDNAIFLVGVVLLLGDVSLSALFPTAGFFAETTGAEAREHIRDNAALLDTVVATVRPRWQPLPLIDDDRTSDMDENVRHVCNDRRPYLGILFENVERVLPGRRLADGAAVCIVQLAGPLNRPAPEGLQMTAMSTRGRRISISVEVVAHDEKASGASAAPPVPLTPRPAAVALAYESAKRDLLPLQGVVGIAELPFRWVNGQVVIGWGLTIFVVCKGVMVLGCQRLPRVLEAPGHSPVIIDVLQAVPLQQSQNPVYSGESAAQRFSMALHNPLRMGCGISVFERTIDESTYERRRLGTLGVFATANVNGERTQGFLTSQNVVGRNVEHWEVNLRSKIITADHFDRVTHPATDEGFRLLSEPSDGTRKKLEFVPRWKPNDVKDLYRTTPRGTDGCMLTVPPSVMPLAATGTHLSVTAAGDIGFVPFYVADENNVPDKEPVAAFAIEDVDLWNAALNAALHWMGTSGPPAVSLTQPPLLHGVDDAFIAQILPVLARPVPEALPALSVMVASASSDVPEPSKLAFKAGYSSGLSLGRFIPGRACIKHFGRGFTFEQHDAFLVTALDANSNRKMPTMLSQFATSGDAGSLVCSWSPSNPEVCEAVGILDGTLVASAVGLALTWLTPLSESIRKDLGGVEITLPSLDHRTRSAPF